MSVVEATSRDWEPPGVKSKEKHRTGVAGGLSSTAYTLGGVTGASPNEDFVGSFVGAGTNLYNTASELTKIAYVKMSEATWPEVQHAMSVRYAKLLAGGVLFSVAAIALWRAYKKLFPPKELDQSLSEEWNRYYLLEDSSATDHKHRNTDKASVIMGVQAAAVPLHTLPHKIQVRIAEAPLKKTESDNLCKTPGLDGDVSPYPAAFNRNDAVPNTEWCPGHEALGEESSMSPDRSMSSSVDPEWPAVFSLSDALRQSWYLGHAQVGKQMPESRACCNHEPATRNLNDEVFKGAAEGWCQCQTGPGEPKPPPSDGSCRQGQTDVAHRGTASGECCLDHAGSAEAVPPTANAANKECCQHHAGSGEPTPKTSWCCNHVPARCNQNDAVPKGSQNEWCKCSGLAGSGEPELPSRACRYADHAGLNQNDGTGSRECRCAPNTGSGAPVSTCRRPDHIGPNHNNCTQNREWCQCSVVSGSGDPTPPSRACRHPGHVRPEQNDVVAKSSSGGWWTSRAAGGEPMVPWNPYQPKVVNRWRYPNHGGCGEPCSASWEQESASASTSYVASNRAWSSGEPVSTSPVCWVVNPPSPASCRLLYSEIDRHVTYRTVDYFDPALYGSSCPPEGCPSSHSHVSDHSCHSRPGSHCPSCPMYSHSRSDFHLHAGHPGELAGHPAHPGDPREGDPSQIDPDAWSMDGTLSGSASTISTLENGSSASISGHGDGVDIHPPAQYKNPGSAHRGGSAPSFSHPSHFHHQSRLGHIYPTEHTAGYPVHPMPYRVEHRQIFHELGRPPVEEVRSTVYLNPMQEANHPQPILNPLLYAGHQSVPLLFRPTPQSGQRLVSQHNYVGQTLPHLRPTGNRKLSERLVH